VQRTTEGSAGLTRDLRSEAGPWRTVFAALILLLAGRAAWAQSPLRPVLETRVVGISERGMAAVAAGSREGVEVGDRFWVFRDGGIDASGEIQVVTDEGSAGAVEETAGISAGRPVTILRSAALAVCRDALPPEATIRGRVARVAPGRRNAWLDIGARSGIKNGDALLIHRLTPGNVELALARGQVETVRDDSSLATLEPLVGNTLPRPGDIAELWPSPADRRMGRVESMVLATRPASEPEGDLALTIVGTAEDGLEKGRLIDLFHGRHYIGHGAITDVGERNSVALMFNAGRRQHARVGDRAWMRSPPGPPPHPLEAAIFQIVSTQDGDYAQMAAGETDGVRMSEKFVVRRQDPADPTIRKDIAELTVQKVESDHSVANIRLISPQGEPVRVWDFAERRLPALPYWRPVGIIGSPLPESRSAVADVDARSPATVGRVVRCIPEEPVDPQESARPPGAAIVIHRSGDEAILYVPPGWGKLEELDRARIELAEEPAAPVPGTGR